MSVVISREHVERDQINGDVLVVSGGGLTLRGQINGTVTVRSGGAACIYGQVTNLVIEPSTEVTLEGMVTGTVTDHRSQQ